MMEKKDMVEKLKKNLAQFYKLSGEERELLEKHKDKLFYLKDDGAFVPRMIGGGLAGIAIYRLPEDFTLSEGGRFVPYPIYEKNGMWWCNIKHLKTTCPYCIDQLPRIVGFAGVMFEGQEEEEEWRTVITQYIDDEGFPWGYSCDNGDRKLATPIKARFWVKGE
jgi:hypothetical protein